jgi:hypothetical protein
MIRNNFNQISNPYNSSTQEYRIIENHQLIEAGEISLENQVDGDTFNTLNQIQDTVVNYYPLISPQRLINLINDAIPHPYINSLDFTNLENNYIYNALFNSIPWENINLHAQLLQYIHRLSHFNSSQSLTTQIRNWIDIRNNSTYPELLIDRTIDFLLRVRFET